GGGSSPTFTVDVTEVDGVQNVEFTGTATGQISMMVEDGVAKFIRQSVEGLKTVALSKDTLVRIYLSDSQQLAVKGEHLHEWYVNFAGTGAVNIEEVMLKESYINDGAVPASVSHDLSKVLRHNVDSQYGLKELGGPAETVPEITVNGNTADFIIANWIYLDDAYYANWPDSYMDVSLTQAKANLALFYK